MVYLDAKTDTYLEEVSSCNIFVVQGQAIRTPPLAVSGRPRQRQAWGACVGGLGRLRARAGAPAWEGGAAQTPTRAARRRPGVQGTILPGVTRRSIIELARSRGYTVEEVPVSVQEAMQADEIFTTGTAVVVSPVGSLTYQGERRQFGTPGQPSPVALELYDALTGLQQERLPDPFGWVLPVC